MSGRKDELLAQIDDVLAKGKAAIETPRQRTPTRSVVNWSGHPLPRVSTDDDYSWVDEGLGARFRAAGQALLEGMFTRDSPQFRDFNDWTDKNTRSYFRRAFGIVETVREMVQKDWLVRATALLAADIFSDFLEMAEYLLSEGYKDPAAVMIGSALEGHLRNLASRHGVSTKQPGRSGAMVFKKAEMLNQELSGASAYSKGDQKNITAWLNLRNEAAHGNYSEYTKDQVTLMLQSVQDFLVRVPA